MRIHCLLHESFEGLASINDWINKKEYTLSITRLYLNETPPEVHDFEFLIIMGGGASVYEEEKYPWLIKEKIFIKQAIESQKKILGICLGAQLLADVLGAKVYPGPVKEIGWFPILFDTPTLPRLDFLPESMKVFHWHGDTFDLPMGAIRIGSTEGIINQGFIFNDHVIALQFHLEMNQLQVKLMVQSCGAELKQSGKFIQTEEQILAQKDFTQNNQIMFSFLDYLTK
jgi:GMP synthase-like glutamine amidotransferase